MTADMMLKMLKTLKVSLPEWSPPEIDRELAAIFMSILADFTDDQIKTGFRLAMSSLTKWPAPAIIKRYCQGTTKTDKELGDEIANQIWAAIEKYGSSSPKNAEHFIGKIGWAVVQGFGGWWSLCEHSTYPQQASLLKAWREAAVGIVKNHQVQSIDLSLGLPPKKEQDGTERLSGAPEATVHYFPSTKVGSDV